MISRKTLQPKHLVTMLVCWIATLACGDSIVHSAETSIAVFRSLSPSAYFSNQTVAHELDLSGQTSIHGTLGWRLSASHRTLSSGEIAVADNGHRSTKLSIPLRLPNVKEGTSLKATLSVELTRVNQNTVRHSHDLWIFPRNPFDGQNEWLKRIELRLYDRSGKTAKMFDEIGLPFHRLRSQSDLRTPHSGITIIAEGVSLNSDPTFDDLVFSLAASGGRVIWFAPRDGTINLAFGRLFEKKFPNELALRKSNMMKELDHRLDDNLWRRVPSSSVSFHPETSDTRPSLRVSEPNDGWSSMEANYSDPAGHLILSGVKLTKEWKTEPTPRYLLASLLKHIDQHADR